MPIKAHFLYKTLSINTLIKAKLWRTNFFLCAKYVTVPRFITTTTQDIESEMPQVSTRTTRPIPTKEMYLPAAKSE